MFCELETDRESVRFVENVREGGLKENPGNILGLESSSRHIMQKQKTYDYLKYNQNVL